jgi:hypothetical protein
VKYTYIYCQCQFWQTKSNRKRESAHSFQIRRRVVDPEGTQYYNIAKSTVQRLNQTILVLWCSKISERHFMLSNLPNLHKKYDGQISKRHFYMGKKL